MKTEKKKEKKEKLFQQSQINEGETVTYDVIDKSSDKEDNEDGSEEGEIVSKSEENKKDEEGSKYSTISIATPNYDTFFSGHMDEKIIEPSASEETAKVNTASVSCFNCLGDHHLSSCPVEKNYKNIMANKKKMARDRPSNVRYHADSINRRCVFGPGNLTESLRSALGLSSNEAPEFVYRMRVLGYPPGWLKHAEVDKMNSLCIFDGAKGEDDASDDERTTIELDETKLFAFPGFNAPFPAEVVDRCEELNFPPVRSHHHLETFRSHIEASKDRKQKKKSKETVLDTSVNMDIASDGETELPTFETPSKKLKRSSLSVPSNSESVSSKPNLLISPAPSSTIGSEELVATLSASKSRSRGISIPATVNLEARLPSADSWSCDVSDHLLFDNLPDSVGMWKRMSAVMAKVRSRKQ